jgi:hypothetical protein
MTRFKIQRLKNFTKTECPFITAAHYMEAGVWEYDPSYFLRDTIACILFVQGVNLNNLYNWIQINNTDNRNKTWSSLFKYHWNIVDGEATQPDVIKENKIPMDFLLRTESIPDKIWNKLNSVILNDIIKNKFSFNHPFITKQRVITRKKYSQDNRNVLEVQIEYLRYLSKIYNSEIEDPIN